MKFVVLNPEAGTRRSIDVPKGETFTILNEEVVVPGEVVYSLEELEARLSVYVPPRGREYTEWLTAIQDFLGSLQEQGE